MKVASSGEKWTSSKSCCWSWRGSELSQASCCSGALRWCPETSVPVRSISHLWNGGGLSRTTSNRRSCRRLWCDTWNLSVEWRNTHGGGGIA
jgi:hypothetical protein